MIGWCTVATTGRPARAMRRSPLTEALAVVNDVEVGPTRCQQAGGPDAEGAVRESRPSTW